MIGRDAVLQTARTPQGSGGRSRIRTYDPLIKSQLLYQLSYAPTVIAGAGL